MCNDLCLNTTAGTTSSHPRDPGTGKVHHLLYSVTQSERWHLEHPGEKSPRYRAADVPRTTVKGNECLLFDWKNTLQERTIGCIKETRFTTVPPHINKDMELSFIYDGTCTFDVDGAVLPLKKGDVLICDPGVVRSSPSYKTENDIVISIVFRREFFDSVFLSRLPGSGALTNMLFDTVASKRKHDRYLMVPSPYTGNARKYIELLFEEYHFAEVYSDELIKGLVNCLLLELMRGLYKRGRSRSGSTTQDETIAGILNALESSYKTCTLSSLAQEFGYNSTYLGNLIKAKTGHTFSELKTSQQLSEAAYLLLNSDRSITSIARKVGISNMTFFYRKFEAVYGVTPRTYRVNCRERNIEQIEYPTS